MQIVRAFWGDINEFIHEIPKTPLFDKEIVVVWGKENEQYFKNLGYKTILAFIYNIDFQYDSYLKHYAHKLEAIRIAEEKFGEYLFLDWDIDVIKPIDDNFYNNIRKRGNLQCPLYAYNQTFFQDYTKYLENNNKLTKNLKHFLISQSAQMKKYHWDYDNNLVLPCFCFLYSNNQKLDTQLINLMKRNNLTTCIEEFAFYLHSNCNLDEYIDRYEPIVIRGKEKDKHIQEVTDAIKSINTYIDSKIEKDIYLIHDARS
jgi:hypothetical protein